MQTAKSGVRSLMLEVNSGAIGKRGAKRPIKGLAGQSVVGSRNRIKIKELKYKEGDP